MINRPDSRRRRFTPALGIGTVTVTVVLAAVAGPLGVGGGLVTALVTLALGPAAGVAIAHLAAVVLLGTPSVAELALFELSVTPLLATPLVETPSLRAAVVAGCSFLALVAVGLFARESAGALWVLAGSLTGALVVAGYTLHRYELVVLGLVPDESPTPGSNR